MRVNDENPAMIDPPSDGGGVDFSTRTNGQERSTTRSWKGRREYKEEEGGDDETKEGGSCEKEEAEE